MTDNQKALEVVDAFIDLMKMKDRMGGEIDRKSFAYLQAIRAVERAIEQPCDGDDMR